MGRIEMSVKEVRRLEVLRQVSDGVVSQVMAAQVLGLSARQLRRLQRRYEQSGASVPGASHWHKRSFRNQVAPRFGIDTAHRATGRVEQNSPDGTIQHDFHPC